jgi:protein-disulfide isomerase
MSGGHLSPPVGAEDHVSGPASAPVTLVEYGDFECGYCGAAYPIVEALRERLGDRLRFVFRHFPLSQAHPHAEHAAEAAEVANEGGKFWEMHRTLYTHQQALGDRDLVRYLAKLGVDADRAEAELREGKFEPRVHRDFASGVRSGVNGTPTFFINGERYDGPWTDPDEFLSALEGAAKGGILGRSR